MLRMAPVKFLLSLIVGTLIMLSGLTPALGFSLLKGGKTQSVNRWPYGFGNRYIYDNAGSRWNYDSAYKHNGYRYHSSKRHAKYWHRRYKCRHQSPMNEKLPGLIEHFSRHRFDHIKPSHITRPSSPNPIYK